MNISPIPVPEQASTASQLLTNVRSIRDQFAIESADANRKLSEAVLAVMMHSKRVESTNRLLALADTCIGQIRARMHVYGIHIDSPSTSSNVVTLVPDINKEAAQGQLLRSKCSDGCILMDC